MGKAIWQAIVHMETIHYAFAQCLEVDQQEKYTVGHQDWILTLETVF